MPKSLRASPNAIWYPYFWVNVTCRIHYTEAEGQQDKTVDKGYHGVILGLISAYYTRARVYQRALLARSFVPSRGSWMNVVERCAEVCNHLIVSEERQGQRLYAFG